MFCSKCGVKLEKWAKYCIKCGTSVYFKAFPENINFFSERKKFIIQSKWKNRWDTGCIMDLNKNILAFFYQEIIWKPQRNSIGRFRPNIGRGLTSDFWIETKDQKLIGQIFGFPPLVFNVIKRNYYEIYNAENSLIGVVREKTRQFGAKWVLENSENRIIASIKGNRNKKNYAIMNPEKQIIAFCYPEKENMNFYNVEIKQSIDSFLILVYVIILDRVKRYPLRTFND